MATFEGTIQEWHKYLDAHIKNKIQMRYRTPRLARRGECEHCHLVRELDSAHKHGRERNTIVDSILGKYLHDGIVHCDLGVVMAEILSEHTVADFLFLCRSCHWLYDNPPEGRKPPL